MPQMVISLKVLFILILALYLLAHVALYYSTGFNLILETIRFFGWLFDSLRWVIDQLKGLTG